jgi:SAM dependent carboxyl methyltransferase
MTDTSTVSNPAPMEGGGGYNRRSSVQAAGLSPAVPLFEQVASIVPLPAAPEPIVIADYGSSEGRNSLAPMSVAIRTLRNRVGKDRSISVVHTDLAESDFSALFRTLTDDPDSYLRRDTATFASAIGRSFYEQILPSASVTLAWSSWALQWLSRTPARISDQVHINASHDAAAIAVYADQAERDWRAFLTCRGRELREGGRLVVLTMALREGDFGLRPLVEAMYGALLDLADEGFIHSDERKRMAIPMVSRSRDNLAAPFVENGHFAGLSMEHLEVFESEDRNWSEFGTDHDAEKFGAKWAAFSRGSVFPTLALSLEGGRHDPRAAKFVDKLEVGMATRLAAAPQPMCIPLARIALVKQDR